MIVTFDTLVQFNDSQPEYISDVFKSTPIRFVL